FRDGGKTGFNTDAEGFLAPLLERGVRLKGKRAVVLGAGGAARAVCAALRKSSVGELLIFNRTSSKAKALARAAGGKGFPWAEGAVREAVGRADLVVNATSLGLRGKGCPLPDDASFRRGALAYDLVYRPRETPFLLMARASGAETLGGLGML